MLLDDFLIQQQQILALIYQVQLQINQPPQGRTKSNIWCEQENSLLSTLILEYGAKNWSFISQKFNQLNYRQRGQASIVQHWVRVLTPEKTQRKWSGDEDNLLINVLLKSPRRQWKYMAKQLEGRTDNQIINRLKVLKNNKKWINIDRDYFP
eukprot:EST43121.1 Myb-like DNA-binding domain-containing protein [Spironucleus salmonicida]